MRELLPHLELWSTQGERVALATVISTWGSAPRRAGSFMAINEKGDIAGSVSGGCVEGAVIEVANEVIQSGNSQLLHFGVADETAWDVGLACGGEIDVFVQPLEHIAIRALLPPLKADEGLTLGTIIGGPDKLLGKWVITKANEPIFVSEDLATPLQDATLKQVQSHEVRNKAERYPLQTAQGAELFVNPIPPSPTLVIVGGVHIAIALAEIARTVHFRTIIVDPRRAFGTPERFAHADRLIQAWPDKAFEELPLSASTALASLSHDPKIDDPALIAALSSPAFYVGALGSSKTQARRIKRMEEKGLDKKDLNRIQGPIGLEIGAQTPEEIALAIMAQVVAAYRS